MDSEKNKTILMIDDHALIRSGIKGLVEKPGWTVYEASSGGEGLEKYKLLKPEIIILDISLPDLSGDEVLKKIRIKDKDVKIIMLSMHSENEFVNQCFEDGANAFVVKSDSASDIVFAINNVLSGKRFLSQKAQQAIVDRAISLVENRNNKNALTAREEDVVSLLKKGLNNNEIADKLSLSRRTVESHRANIMKKLGVKNIVELIQKTSSN